MDLTVFIVGNFDYISFIYRESSFCFSFIDVFDVYIQRKNNKAYLVDFNPFSPTTDALLYHWDELMSCKLK